MTSITPQFTRLREHRPPLTYFIVGAGGSFVAFAQLSCKRLCRSLDDLHSEQYAASSRYASNNRGGNKCNAQLWLFAVRCS